MTEPDMSTSYLGLKLRSPLVASSSPLTSRIETLLELQDAGVGAVVLPSLFQEEIEAEEMAAADRMDMGEEFPEFASPPIPPVDHGEVGAQRHLSLVTQAREALEIPVIASLNGARPGDWAYYAQQLQDAGAQALELNLYSVNADPNESAAHVEDRYLQVIETVRNVTKIPVAIKLSHHLSALGNFAKRVESAGADGLVLFNRFYGAEVELESLEIVAKRALSHPDELREPLRWIAILRAQLGEMSLAATSGVHSGEDIVKTLLVGADVAYTASAVIKNGPSHVSTMLNDARSWVEGHDYESITQLKSSMSASNVDNPSEFERAQYMRALSS